MGQKFSDFRSPEIGISAFENFPKQQLTMKMLAAEHETEVGRQRSGTVQKSFDE